MRRSGSDGWNHYDMSKKTMRYAQGALKKKRRLLSPNILVQPDSAIAVIMFFNL